MATLPTLLQHASTTKDKDTQLHLLPFHVSYAGPARVSSYFTPVPSSPASSSSSSSSTAYFRGRLLRGVDVQLPDGYAGQLWRSNAPSVSVTASSSSSLHKSASAAASGTIHEDYNANSPRRSPRKYAQSASQSSAASANKKQKTSTSSANGNVAKKTIMTGKNKPKAAKRQRFAMSPDASPVKEEETNGGGEQGGRITDIPKEAAAMLLDSKGVAIAAAKKEDQSEQVDSETSSPAIKVATSPAKPVLAQPKEEEAVEDSTIAAAAALARKDTPPPPSPSTPALIPPSTPSSAAALPIHVLSPSTPRTPSGRGSSSMFGNKAFQSPIVDDDDDANIDNKRTHQRLIQPIARFGKITIWNPDVELDAGDDCYVKTLAEWPMLAELIHA